MKEEYQHTSFAGTYWIDCEILKKIEDEYSISYKIKYFDPIVEEEFIRDDVQEDRVRISPETDFEKYQLKVSKTKKKLDKLQNKYNKLLEKCTHEELTPKSHYYP